MKPFYLPVVLCMLFFLPASGQTNRVGINNANPSATLDVSGTIRSDSVGVGMLPTQRLSINGNETVTGNVVIGGTYQYSVSRQEITFLGPSMFVKSATATGEPVVEQNDSYLVLDHSGASTQGYEAATINLPTGVVIDSIVGQFFLALAAGSTSAEEMRFYRISYGTASVSGNNVASAVSATAANAPASVFSLRIIPAELIDNGFFHYSLRLTMPNDGVSKFYGAKIYYSKQRIN